MSGFLARFRPIGRALAHRNFAIYIGGNAVSLVGTWMQRVAVGWLTWQLTESGAWLGLIAFADLFPTILIGPIAGAVADRLDRLRVNKVTQALALVQAAALFVLTVTGLIDIWLLFALTFFLGIVSAFNQPARLALISSLVPKPELATAVAVNSITVNTARFIGPALAGLLIVTVGVAAAFALNMLSFAAMLWALARLDIAPDGDGKGPKGPFLRDLAEGLSYSARHPGIAAVLVLMIAASVGARPIMELLPGFAEAVFEAGAPGLAALSSALGLGAILAGLYLGQRPPGGLTSVLLRSTILLAAAVALFTMSDNLGLAVAIMVAVGFFLGSTGIAAQSLVQISVDAAMRGRVLSIYGLIFRGGPAVGALMMGVASEAVGLPLPLFAGAIALTLTWLWATRRREAMQRHLEWGSGPAPSRPQ